MVRINLLSKEEQKFAALQIQAAEALYNRSANLRDPESKKVKCHQCGLRLTVAELRNHGHNFIRPFETEFRENEDGTTEEIRTVTPIEHGRWQVKGKRKNPHFSALRLQLVVRTREKIPVVIEADDLSTEDFNFLVREARVAASRELRSERKAKSKQYRDTQKRSRAINRG
jgi:hypothetical protein